SGDCYPTSQFRAQDHHEQPWQVDFNPSIPPPPPPLNPTVLPLSLASPRISRSASNVNLRALQILNDILLSIDILENISLRLRSVSCIGLHDKTEVRFKLQNKKKTTKPALNLGDHTRETVDFLTTVHNMTFDIIKIDLYDIGPLRRHKIGRAYLPLRDLQKKVGNKYDNDGDDSTEPEQSVLSTLFDTAAFCKEHDDVFEIDLPLYKHGSYSKFGSSSPRQNHKGHEKDMTMTKGSEHGRDVSAVERPHLVHSDSFAQQAMNGVEVGMITIQATLHFKDQLESSLFDLVGRQAGVSGGKSTSQRVRLHSNRSMDYSSHSSDSSTHGDDYRPDQRLPRSPGKTESATLPGKTVSGNRHQKARILRVPSSPPNVSLHYGADGSPKSPLSPTLPLTPGSPTSPSKPSPWDESDLSYGDDFIDDDDAGYDEQNWNEYDDHIKGENLTEADRKREEELMADIMANGDQAKKDLYLNRSEDGQSKGHHSKDKKFKFSLFPEQTLSAFKDIQLMYSSFFGHGWNLSRAEFWRGFHVVEQYYARRPTPTTNKAFGNIEILEKARHFVRLAIASYGSLPWVYFGYSYKAAPLNFMRINSDRKNVMDYFKLKKEDMIVWHFDKRTALVPSYYIVRDPMYNALCIIIRGTF
ncbi:hypothetical protein BGZ65_008387, partial [Modicella reniformis]